MTTLRAMVRNKNTARLIVLSFFLVAFQVQTHARTVDQLTLTQAQASHFASLALKCIQKQYPNKPDHTINDKDDVRSPREMHPAFYGCLDWYSTVHGQWMLVRLLKLYPNLPEAKQIRAALDTNLS